MKKRRTLTLFTMCLLALFLVLPGMASGATGAPIDQSILLEAADLPVIDLEPAAGPIDRIVLGYDQEHSTILNSDRIVQYRRSSPVLESATVSVISMTQSTTRLSNTATLWATLAPTYHVGKMAEDPTDI